MVVRKMKLETQAAEVLKAVGINKGHIVLDFGCGCGTYTIPAARLVGEEGKVYALDKDKRDLDKLMQKAKSEGLRNIERIDASGESRIKLADESVDVVLLFDVFHSYYFTGVDNRRRLLDEIARIARPDALISVWPKHMELDARDEIENANFYLESEYSGTLIHENDHLETGHVLNFRKKPRAKNVENRASFQDYAIVACGTLNMELNYLRDSGFLDARKILYTKPGRHEVPRELESQLIKQIGTAKKKYAQNIIVVYGGKFCYVNTDNLYRKIDTIIQEQEESGVRISRIKATHCMDMLASEGEREKISQGKDIYWLTPGWMRYRYYVYQDWDKGLANENFPKHTGGAIMLDAIGYYNKVMENEPEKILEFSDWMGIPIEPHRITLDRLESLLLDQIKLEE